MYNFDDLGKKISEIDERIDALIAKTGLSYSEFAVLYTLAKDGRSTQKKISEEWLIPKQTVFNVCKDFRQKGLVQPSEQSADKRERAMSLTQKGRDAADPIVHASDELGERVFARLGEKNAEKLFSLLTRFCEICNKEIENTPGIQTKIKLAWINQIVFVVYFCQNTSKRLQDRS